MHIAHDPNEIIACVDGDDSITGKATREDAHSEGLWHREAYCYILNTKKQVLLQKRADNHLWDTSGAGHFPFNQTYEEAIIREIEEELGIKLEPHDFKEVAKEKLTIARKINNRFVKLFIVQKDIPLKIFNIDKTEVEEVRYFNKTGIKSLLLSNDITLTAKYLIEKYILPML